MKTARIQLEPKWIEMAKQLKVNCEIFNILENCARNLRAISADAGDIQGKISNALNVALSIREDALLALMIELTDLNANDAEKLTQHMTEYISPSELACLMTNCSEPPLVKYRFGWWFNLNIRHDYDDDSPF